jgi:alpha-L-glutamate ligase-like protein
MAMLRLATHASDGKANLHQGAVGVGLALETGGFASAVQFGQLVDQHPDTRRDLASMTIPGWRKLLLIAAQCYEMTGLGYLGTDIVLDRDRGPMLLELNARPGLSIQVANSRGLLPRLRHVETLRETRRSTPEARVDYAMQSLALL